MTLGATGCTFCFPPHVSLHMGRVDNSGRAAFVTHVVTVTVRPFPGRCTLGQALLQVAFLHVGHLQVGLLQVGLLQDPSKSAARTRSQRACSRLCTSGPRGHENCAAGPSEHSYGTTTPGPLRCVVCRGWCHTHIQNAATSKTAFYAPIHTRVNRRAPHVRLAITRYCSPKGPRSVVGKVLFAKCCSSD